MGQKKKYEKICFSMKKNMRCGVWDEVVEQKGTLPPSKSSIGSKESAKKRIWKHICIYAFFILIFIFLS